MIRKNKAEKIPNLLEKVKSCIDQGTYRFTKHALERKNERFVTLPDILEILHTGYHEKIKDQWDVAYKVWNYAIRGKDVDQEDIRVIVSFDQNGLLIITVIRLE